MKKVLLILAVVALAAAKFQYTQEFHEWKVKHSKVYETEEVELARQIIWESNKKFVENHNANADKFGFTVAMNEFADLVSNANQVFLTFSCNCRMLLNFLTFTMVFFPVLLPTTAPTFS